MTISYVIPKGHFTILNLAILYVLHNTAVLVREVS